MKQVKYILSIVAMVAILFHSGAYTAVFVGFQLNQTYISAKLCENRFSPELKCEGKCYLKKQFNAQSQQVPEGDLLTVQQNMIWFTQVEVIESQSLALEVPVVPAASYQAFITQHNTAPRPHPPSEA